MRCLSLKKKRKLKTFVPHRLAFFLNLYTFENFDCAECVIRCLSDGNLELYVVLIGLWLIWFADTWDLTC